MAIAATVVFSQADIKRLNDKLSGLADKFARKVMARAMREGAKIMLAEYKNNLSRMQDTGHMMASAEIRPMKRKRGRFAVGSQVVNDAKTWDKPDRKKYGKYSFPYPFSVEYGHDIGKRSSGHARLSKNLSRRRRQLIKANQYISNPSAYFALSAGSDRTHPNRSLEFVQVRRLARRRGNINIVTNWLRQDIERLEKMKGTRQGVPGKFPMTRAFDSTVMRVRARIFEIADEGVRNIQRTLAAEAGVG